jgi:hypothetical protein
MLRIAANGPPADRCFSVAGAVHGSFDPQQLPSFDHVSQNEQTRTEARSHA